MSNCDFVARSSLNSLTTSLTDITTGSKTAKAGFTDFGAAVVKALEEMLIKMIIIMPIAKQLQSILGGGIGSLTSSGAPAGYSPGFLSGLYHSGGMTNEPSGYRYVHPAYFDHAPRFHSGIGPGEIPAVIRKDESVLTPGQMRGLSPAGGGNSVQVNVINNAPNTTVQSTKRKSGNVDTHKFIISAVGSAIANGRLDGPLQSRSGQKIKPRGR